MIGAISDPIVVLKDKTENCFVEAKRSSVEVTDGDIVTFVRTWIVNRYEWEKLDEEQLVRSLSPMTSEGLISKIREQFRNGPEKEFKDKAVIQYVSKDIRVNLSKNTVVASFDRIVRVNGIPLVDPAEMEFSLVRGTKTKQNPHGIYVNGITEHKSN